MSEENFQFARQHGSLPVSNCNSCEQHLKFIYHNDIVIVRTESVLIHLHRSVHRYEGFMLTAPVTYMCLVFESGLCA